MSVMSDFALSVPWTKVNMSRNECSVFISYSHDDRDLAHSFAVGIKDEGFTVLWDVDGLLVGDRIEPWIVAAIKDATFFLALVTVNSSKSQWCAIELLRAWKRHANDGMIILPVRVGEVDMPPKLEDHKYLTFRLEAPAESIAELTKEMRSHFKRLRGRECPRPKSAAIVSGTVKWFNDTRGFGFITQEGEGKGVFRHDSAIVAEIMSTF
jgi:CspA family cold shock protein